MFVVVVVVVVVGGGGGGGLDGGDVEESALARAELPKLKLA